MNREQITELILGILSEYDRSGQQKERELEIPVEVSARHVHLSEAAAEALFGKGNSLTIDRMLSQPGQFLSKERVALVTQKGRIDQVAVLGPARPEVQVELSVTDCRQLGIQAPVRISGNLADAADVYLVGPKGIWEAKKSVIVAQAHIHIPPQEAEQAGVRDGEEVSVTIGNNRKITLEQVICRVGSQAGLAMHIDFDEANACQLSGNTYAGLRKKGRIRESEGLFKEQKKNQSEKEGERGEQKKTQEEFVVTKSSLPYLIGGKLITEAAARQLAAKVDRELTISGEIILTPSAKDFLRHAGIHIVGQGGYEL